MQYKHSLRPRCDWEPSDFPGPLAKVHSIFMLSLSLYPFQWLRCNPILGKYCGKTLPEPVKASTQSLYIMFHSDELDAFKGFKAEWTSTYNGTKTSPEPTDGPTQGAPTIKSAAHGKRVTLWNIVLSLIFVANQIRHTVEANRILERFCAEWLLWSFKNHQR